MVVRGKKGFKNWVWTQSCGETWESHLRKHGNLIFLFVGIVRSLGIRGSIGGRGHSNLENLSWVWKRLFGCVAHQPVLKNPIRGAQQG